ncbi:MAG TPA: hypothetical protein VJS92_02225, partial [Candidatus Polarisedimenticolaceae bacterium]|nr:hypothetical protein [Candidatus Polarisedimenticolaceae bacterium]
EPDKEPAAAPPAPAPQEVTVRVGRKTDKEQDQRYVAKSGFGFAGTAWESTVRPLLEQKVEELLGS